MLLHELDVLPTSGLLSPRDIVREPLVDEFPIGWYQVAWSADCGPKSVQPLYYFDEHLVLFRTESGVATVMSAFCLHMGAHLGHGGRVEGECIACPFHGWLWGRDGENVAIPYNPLTRDKKIQAWPTVEQNGAIFVWYHPHGEEPHWHIPVAPEWNSPDYHQLDVPGSRQLGRFRMAPQLLAENSADSVHIEVLHRWKYAPTCEQTFDKHLYTSVLTGRIDSQQGETPFRMAADFHGLGYNESRLSGVADTLLIGCVTPIDKVDAAVRMSMYVRNDPTRDNRKVAAAIYRAEYEEIFGTRGDATVWAHMRYLKHGALIREDQGVSKVRRWSRQFYAPKRGTDAQTTTQHQP